MVVIFLGGHVIPLKLTAVEVNEAWMTFLTQPSFKCGFPSNINIFTIHSFSIKNNSNYLIISSNLLRQNLKQMCIFIYMVSIIFSAILMQICREHIHVDRLACLRLGPAREWNHDTNYHCPWKREKAVWQWPVPKWLQCNWLLQVWSQAHSWLLPEKGSFLPLLLTQPFPKPALLSKPW